LAALYLQCQKPILETPGFKGGSTFNILDSLTPKEEEEEEEEKETASPNFGAEESQNIWKRDRRS